MIISAYCNANKIWAWCRVSTDCTFLQASVIRLHFSTGWRLLINVKVGLNKTSLNYTFPDRPCGWCSRRPILLRFWSRPKILALAFYILITFLQIKANYQECFYWIGPRTNADCRKSLLHVATIKRLGFILLYSWTNLICLFISTSKTCLKVIKVSDVSPDSDIGPVLISVQFWHQPSSGISPAVT